MSVEKKEIVSIRNLLTKEIEQNISFLNRKLTFMFSATEEKFRAVEFPVTEIPFSHFAKKELLNEAQVIELRKQFGSNEKIVEIPKIYEFMLKEMTSPFYFL